MTSKTITVDIDELVNRFLSWKLPEHFNPDGGISFNPVYPGIDSKFHRREPIGTNLFDVAQARQMIEHMLATAVPVMTQDADERRQGFPNPWFIQMAVRMINDPGIFRLNGFTREEVAERIRNIPTSVAAAPAAPPPQDARERAEEILQAWEDRHAEFDGDDDPRPVMLSDIASALEAVRQEERERSVAYIRLVADDWDDAGDFPKKHAAHYLADSIARGDHAPAIRTPSPKTAENDQ